MSRFGTMLITVLMSLAVGSTATAKILVVSDIDDTLKESYVLNKIEMLRRALRTDLAFPGLANTYQGLRRDQASINQEVRFAYVSSAPAAIMQEFHAKFLGQNGFPLGYLQLRSGANSQEFKLQAIRQIVAEEKPQAVILIGDHGERDPEIYRQLSVEFLRAGLPHIVFIRQLYAPEDGPMPLAEGQRPFVSAAELGLGLYDAGLLSANTLRLDLVRFRTPGASYARCRGHRVNAGRSAIEIPDVVQVVAETTARVCR